MSYPKHLPLIAWSRQEMADALREHRRAIEAIAGELDRRGDRDVKHHGFPVIDATDPHHGLAYAHFPTLPEAFAAAVEAFPELHDAAPYRVHPVYLGKDDSA